MSALGVHFAINEDLANELQEYDDDREVLNHVEHLEESYMVDHPDFVCETDKAWDPIHRVLTDGELNFENGAFPLNYVILGGKQLYEEDDYIVSLKTAEEVAEVYEELRNITEAHFKQKYLERSKHYPVELGEVDFEYVWSWFEDLIAFYERAADAQRCVLFTVDQ